MTRTYAARRLALAVCLAVVSAACGARLSDEQRQAGIAVLAGGSGSDEAASADTTPGDTTDVAATPSDTLTDSATDSNTPSVADNGGGGRTTSGGPSRGGGTAAAKCKPSGGAEPGIGARQVTVAVASDITGPSPGLFKSTHEAVQAYANYINTKGGVCGRQMKVMKLDTKTDSGGNRAAVLDACSKAFAMVGSMSAFDDGGAQAVDECKIPDITAIPTSPERVNAEWTRPVFPSRQDLVATGTPRFIRETYGDAVVKKAAILWLNATVTRNNANARQAAWETEGFFFEVRREAQVLEANYTPFVQEMRDKGIEYVTMVADNNSIARLLKAAKQQGWAPTVWDWDSVAYDPGFIELAGDAAEGSHVFINTRMLEEASGNAEMALYAEWLAKTAPSAEPDYFGLYAWSAAALFVDSMVAIGPTPTRQALLDRLQATAEWDGHGLHGVQKVGTKTPTTCYIYMKISGGKFQRLHPQGANALDCNADYARL